MINQRFQEEMFITLTHISKKTLQLGKDILDSDGMKYEKNLKHHGTISCYDHSVNVAEKSLKIVGFFSLKVNERALIRGALLHDYFLYDWHEKDDSHKWHGFHHAEKALYNAMEDFDLNEVEQDMIRCHMFPLNPRPPKYMEGWIICYADKVCSGIETVKGMKLPAIFFKMLAPHL